ncbi:hypothetical protein SB5439_05120 [Klebsiella variicola]|uniref:DUF2815 family protein n=1 Tax=Klebsiella variicola TaxID=244366 RepID=UPI00109CB584|nr:DUF2815 family protein [Klebsiella variicola]VGQ12965.1 hypothetical protein SB5439_05120 [Klebsiella variicola]
MIISNVRIAFADIFVPKAQGDNPQEKFAATFLIPEGSEIEKKIEAEILAKAEAKWPGKGAQTIKSIRGNNMRFCFRPEGEKDYNGFAGNRFFKATNVARPTIIDRDKTPLTQADGKPYAGCYVNASVEFYAYENNGKGIACQLKGIQFFKDGDAFSGGGVASPDDFDDLGFDNEEESHDFA